MPVANRCSVVLALGLLLLSPASVQAWPGSRNEVARGGSPRAPRVLTRVRETLGLAASPEPPADPDERERVGAARLQEGVAALDARHWLAGAQALVDGLTAAPDSAASWTNLGSILRQLGHWDLSRRCLATAVELDPGNAVAHFVLATVLEHVGDLEEADAEYLLALRLKPSLWAPSINPLIVGNKRAALALHRWRVDTPPQTNPLLARDQPAEGPSRSGP
jgi:tetratricopeptide (TPR) repeat protein